MIPVVKLQPFITFSPAQCDWALLETHIAVDFQAAAWPLAHWHSRVIGRADVLKLFLFPLMTFLFLLSNTSPLLFTFYSRLLLRIELCWNQNKTKNQTLIRVQSIPPAIAKLTLIGIDCSLSHSIVSTVPSLMQQALMICRWDPPKSYLYLQHGNENMRPHLHSEPCSRLSCSPGLFVRKAAPVLLNTDVMTTSISHIPCLCPNNLFLLEVLSQDGTPCSCIT